MAASPTAFRCWFRSSMSTSPDLHRSAHSAAHGRAIAIRSSIRFTCAPIIVRAASAALVRALFPIAAAMDKHIMIGGIDADNTASLRMHERLGFERVAHFREVGRKFGRWLDLVFVQRFIDAPGAPRAQ